ESSLHKSGIVRLIIINTSATMKMQVFLIFTQMLVMRVFTQSQECIVTIPNGPIRGMQESVSSLASLPYFKGRDLTYRKYLGIPYADPPVGDLRFEPPQPLSTKWRKTRNATKYSNSCWPASLSIGNPDEDCLYLNVWAPGNGSSTVAKAVMVWIHGGGYSYGSAEAYDPTMLTVIGDVVVVNMNYRLGIFGFLSTGNNVVPGNMGLLDQKIAIRWVRDNIALFGGDPKKITIFGQSAGGASVSQHATSPTNIGVFQRAICQSGTMLSRFALNRDILPFVKRTAAKVSCDLPKMVEMVKCLRKVKAKDLLTAALPPPSLLGDLWKWMPVVDGNFIVEDPLDMKKKKRGPVIRMLKSIDLMIGFNNHDGFSNVWVWAKNHLQKDAPSFPQAWDHTASFLSAFRNLVKYYTDTNYAGVSTVEDAFSYAYLDPDLGNDTGNEKLAEITHDFMTDARFKIPTIEFVKMHAAQEGRTYLYEFTQKNTGAIGKPEWLKGAEHSDDLPYLFPDVATFLGRPKSEQGLSHNMITYWTNFAKTGNPNEPASSQGLPEWQTFTTDSGMYLKLSNNITLDGGITKTGRIELWTEFLPKIAGSAKCEGRKIMRKMNRKEEKSDGA
ncbi:unnamed protein product, partial [Owenia fusiformis]